jgi:peptidoglycan/xylan/chitin deacetylase (PgdA/CDA1 family)
VSGLRDRAALAVRGLEARLAALSGRTERNLAARQGVAVLMYHRVLDDRASVAGIEPGMFVKASAFRAQMEWLAGRWRVVPLGEAFPGEPPGVTAVVTFDDGWRDNLTVAWPILSALGIRPTIFLVRDWVRAGRTPRGEFVRPGEVAELAAAGVEFGAHTATHPHLDRLPAAAAAEEMRLSREAVEEWTGRPCRVFAYPYGHHNAETVEAARGVFERSVIVGGGWWGEPGDLSRIPRIGIHQDMSSSIPRFTRCLARTGGGR